jgi:hypothetical protein
MTTKDHDLLLYFYSPPSAVPQVIHERNVKDFEYFLLMLLAKSKLKSQISSFCQE